MAKQTKSSPQNREDLQRLKDAHDLTIEELATITGIARSTVNEWLAGDRPMPDRSMRLLKLELGIVKPAWTLANRRKSAA